MDDDELLRVLRRIAQQDPPGDPRRRKLADEALPDSEPGGRDGLATRPRAAREPHEARVPLDDETRARLAERLASQLRDARADAPPPSSLVRPVQDRRSGIRVRNLPAWELDAEEPAIAHGGRPAADAGSLYGTSVVPLDTEAPVCRSIGDGSEPPPAPEPPRGTRPDEAPGLPVERAPDVVAAADAAAARPADAAAARPADAAAARPAGAAAARPAGAAAAREGPSCPELTPRRSPLRARAGTIAAAAGWIVGVALVSLLALRPAPFAPGAAPLPGYTLAMHVGDDPAPRAPGAASATEPRVGRGARLTIALTPEGRVPAPVEVQAYLLRDGNARPWPVAIGLDGHGGARISGTREALFQGVAAGAWEVVIVIGQPGSLPLRGEALPDEGAVRLSGGRVLRQRLFLD
ncbi:hypothetical protein SOCEGT47_009340 [Sorangium cellulosum]|uniref:Uncharacterized protein n=1 Tax=Sorangium cellulosum TaxID=56 RepID=A0A4P2PVI7_SORCE|nr:hypothetical protein [Sorangium cellulosum]AUX20463.1 hypothetical protein SOCEGT47_009340 [Sorangium cellulosum]